MPSDRRNNSRVWESRLITEFVHEIPAVASSINLSKDGIFIVKPNIYGPEGPARVQLEIPVPEASESIWACGDVVFEAVNSQKIGTGIRLVDMARFHRSLLRDVIEMRRAEQRHKLMRELRWKKINSAPEMPFFAPPPAVRERAIRVYN